MLIQLLIILQVTLWSVVKVWRRWKTSWKDVERLEMKIRCEALTVRKGVQSYTKLKRWGWYYKQKYTRKVEHRQTKPKMQVLKIQRSLVTLYIYFSLRLSLFNPISCSCSCRTLEHPPRAQRRLSIGPQRPGSTSADRSVYVRGGELSSDWGLGCSTENCFQVHRMAFEGLWANQRAGM